jgi:hypothetical protein
MNSENLSDLLLFGRRYLESRGAVIEATPDGFDALLPQGLAESLGIPDYVQFKEARSTESKDEYTLTYGSPLLDKMVELSCDRLPLTCCQLSFHYLKSQGFDRLIQDQFTFRKTLCRVTSTAAIKTDYLALTCRYVARSDEQKEGLVLFSFHLDTGALIPLQMEKLVGAGAEISPLHAFSINKEKWDRIINVLPWVSEPAIEEQIRDFRESMNRRLRRDTKNIEEYYQTLKKEMELSLERAGLSTRLVQERREKIELIPEELAKKKEDLLRKYSIRVKVIPCAALVIRTPAVRVLCDAHVGREKRPLSLTYNPLTKALDPLICQGCSSTTTTVSFCSRHHVLCPQCSEKCPACDV